MRSRRQRYLSAITKSGLSPGWRSSIATISGKCPGLHREHLDAVRRLDLLDRLGIEDPHELHFARDERVDPRHVVGDAEDLELVDVGTALPEVVRDCASRASVSRD